DAAVLLEPAVQLQLTLPLGLAVHAQAGEREGLEPSLRDLPLAALADAVAAVVDAAERLVYGLNLLTVAVAQDEVDLLVASVAGKVVGIHALVLALVANLVQVLLDAPEELCAHLFERVPRFLEKRLAHRPTPPPRGGGNLEPRITQVNAGRIQNDSGKIVGVGGCDAHPDEVPRGPLPVPRHGAVDLRRLVPGAADQGPRTNAVGLDEHVELAADLGACPRRGHAGLRGHDALPAAPLDPLGELPRMGRRLRALLARVSEDADAVELELLQEDAQLVDVSLALSREADDERRAQGDA